VCLYGAPAAFWAAGHAARLFYTHAVHCGIFKKLPFRAPEAFRVLPLRMGGRNRTLSNGFGDRHANHYISPTSILTCDSEAALSEFPGGGFKIFDLELPVARVLLINVAESAGDGHSRSTPQRHDAPLLRGAVQHDLLLLDGGSVVELRARSAGRQG
jgi:hypothetical protein